MSENKIGECELERIEVWPRQSEEVPKDNYRIFRPSMRTEKKPDDLPGHSIHIEYRSYEAVASASRLAT